MSESNEVKHVVQVVLHITKSVDNSTSHMISGWSRLRVIDVKALTVDTEGLVLAMATSKSFLVISGVTNVPSCKGVIRQG